MSTLFCTTCGQGINANALFCEHCDAGLSAKTEPLSSTKSADIKKFELPPEKARFVFSNWVIPFNATLIFGITLAGILDFLSPRVALLPVAATLAVAELITALLLRKFVAPSLPSGSALHRALAPNVSLHKSPLLISASTLSALLVSGAAWSNASAAAGGIIAGKFDAARNAQMQLGVLQGLQKEQRVQTAALEDIREGRAVDPRKELINLGADWEASFQQALASGDARIVNLFLAAKKEWNVSDAFLVMSLNKQDMLDLLVKNTDLFRRAEGDCVDIIERRILNYFPNLMYNKREFTAEWVYRRLTDLGEGHTNFLGTFCRRESDKASIAVRYKTFLKERAELKKFMGSSGGTAVDESNRQLKLYQQVTSQVNQPAKQGS